MEEFDLTISPLVTVAAKLAPPNSRGWRTGRHRVELTNAGNVDTSVFIDARDPDELLSCRYAQQAVVPAGETISVPLVVSPLSGGRVLGRPAAFPFEVEVFPSGSQALALRGSMRQRPLLSPQILVAAAVLVAVVVAVIALGQSDPKSSAQARTENTAAADDTVPSSTTSTSVEATTTTTIISAGSTTVPSTTIAPAAGAPVTPSAGQPSTQTGSGASTGSPPQQGGTPVAEEQPPTEAPAAPAPAPVATPAPTTPPIPATPAMKLGPTYAGDGVIYGVTQSGDLLFYQDLRQDGTSDGVTGEGWAPTGGHRVGCGFGAFEHLIGAEFGMIYAVDSTGTFRWYQDLARNGTNDACAGGGNWAGGNAMGTGWSGYKHIFYGGDGIIYAVDPSGNLRFCQDVGLNGSFDTVTCPVIGTGWGDMRQVFSTGAPGVIYAINPAGDLLYFRDTLRNGTNANTTGWIGPLPVGNTWQTMYHVFGGAINSSTYPNGVIYAIGSDGTLQWRQDTLQDGSAGIGGSKGWAGPSTVGVGWQGFL